MKKAPLLIAAALVALLTPTLPLANADPSPVRTEITTADAAAAFVLHATNPAGFTYDGLLTYYSHPYNELSFELWALLPDGTIWPQNSQDISAPFAGREGGIAYVGVGPATVGNPAEGNLPYRQAVRSFGVWHTAPTDLYLVIAWLNNPGPLSVEIEWSPGTTVERVADGTMAFFRPRDLDQGIRAHVGGTVYANVADGLTYAPPNAQTLGVLAWSKYNLPARGELRVDYGWGSRTVSYDATLDAIEEECFTWRDWRQVFTTSNSIHLNFDYVGVTAGLDAFTLALISFPPGTLPDQTSRDWFTPAPCDVD